MKRLQRHGNLGTDTLILAALARGPLTPTQIDARVGLCRGGCWPALRLLVAGGQVVPEPFEGSAKYKQYRAVRPQIGRAS